MRRVSQKVDLAWRMVDGAYSGPLIRVFEASFCHELQS